MSIQLPQPAEIQRVYRLIHELCESGADTYAWRDKMLHAIEEMVHAQISVSYVFHFSLDPNDLAPRTVVYLERGTPEIWKRYIAAGDVSDNPVTPGIMKRFGTDFTVTRNELIDDAAWYASDHFRDVMNPSGMDDAIYSQIAVKEPRVVNGLGIVRATGMPRFTQTEVALVHFIHQELGRLWNRADPIGIHTLPTRQREVMYGIQRGESRKTIAKKMGVSTHTVHTYEKALFDRAQVTSRGELLAKLSGIIRPNLLP